jgi:hypothetical protein
MALLLNSRVVTLLSSRAAMDSSKDTVLLSLLATKQMPTKAMLMTQIGEFQSGYRGNTDLA